MQKVQPTKVLIVGAGPTGLTLALILQSQGIDYCIIDKKNAISETSKAIGLQVRVSEVLYWLNIYPEFEKQAAFDNYSVNFYNCDHRFFSMNLERVAREIAEEAATDAFSPRSMMIPQSATEKILETKLLEAGGNIMWKHELVKFEYHEKEIRSLLKKEQDEVTTTSQYLVSCEGSHSSIRKLAGISFKGKTFPIHFLIVDAEMESNLSRNEVHVWFHEDGTFSLLPLPGHIWRIFIEIKSGSAKIDMTNNVVREILQKRTLQKDIVIQSILWTSDFKINSRMAETFKIGNIFLAGDAAHIHSPTGGQGITTGIQDAYNLGWKLVQVIKHNAPESLLDTYNLNEFR